MGFDKGENIKNINLFQYLFIISYFLNLEKPIFLILIILLIIFSGFIVFANPYELKYF
jgi:hypothetical protein